MSVDLCPGIRDVCAHWSDAPMLQHTRIFLVLDFMALCRIRSVEGLRYFRSWGMTGYLR